jgi:uncharacterized cupredoxin-like copper-binding protein
MRTLSMRQARRTVVCAAVLGLTWPALQASAAGPALHTAGKAQFLSWNAKKHTVTFQLTAGLTSDNHTLNFNGYTSGGMVVSVPKNYKVKVVFTNKSTFPHSAVFTLAADKSSSGDHPLAFAGASTTNPVAGTAPSASETFSFKAKKVGTYAIICEVGHHADAGMWDTFKVTNGKQPSIKLTAAPSPTPTP